MFCSPSMVAWEICCGLIDEYAREQPDVVTAACRYFVRAERRREAARFRRGPPSDARQTDGQAHCVIRLNGRSAEGRSRGARFINAPLSYWIGVLLILIASVAVGVTVAKWPDLMLSWQPDRAVKLLRQQPGQLIAPGRPRVSRSVPHKLKRQPIPLAPKASAGASSRSDFRSVFSASHSDGAAFHCDSCAPARVATYAIGELPRARCRSDLHRRRRRRSVRLPPGTSPGDETGHYAVAAPSDAPTRIGSM